MPGITISAAYGAGGQTVAHAVAERLNLPVLDRAISTAVAERLQVSEQEAEGGELKRSFTDRFFAGLARMSPEMFSSIGGDGSLTPEQALALDDTVAFRDEAERIMREAMDSGAVVHGRSAACVFADDPSVLKVRIYGDPAACLRQAQELHHVGEDEAKQAQREVDHARAHYMKRLYGRDIEDPSLYTLLVDGTVLRPEQVVEVILSAWSQLAGTASAPVTA